MAALTSLSCRMLASAPSITAPAMVPTMEPAPPNRSVPPITTAAMALSSYPVPSFGLPKENCPACTIPATADARPVSA